MQYRRHEEFGVPSSTGRDRKTDLGPDNFLMTRSRRSVSPRRMERVLGGDRRSYSLERRNCGWDLGVNRGGHLRDRSPPFGEVKRLHRYDDGVIHKDFPPLEVHARHKFIDRMGMNMNLDVGSGGRNNHDFKHSGSRAIREDFDGGRLNSGRHGMVDQNSMDLEDGPDRGMYRLAADAGPTSKFEERGGNFASANMGLNQPRDERARYRDPFLVDKLSSREPYREGEKSIFHLRDDPYSNATASKSKDLTRSPHFKDFVGTSAGNSRANFPSSYRGGVPSPMEVYPKSSVEITEPLDYAGYGPRQCVDTRRNPDVENKDDLVRYGRDTFSPTRSEHQDYLHSKPIVRENDDYPSDLIYRRMDLHERMDYSRRDLLRSSMVDPVTDCLDNTQIYRGNLSNNSLWNHHSHEKQSVSNYVGLSSAALKQGGQYLDSTRAHFELGRKISREAEMPYLGMSRDRENTHLRSSHDFKRDVGPESCKERVRSSPDFSYDTELHRPPERTRQIEQEKLGNHDPSNRVMKRKYIMDEEMSRRTSRNIMPSEWNNSGMRDDQNDWDDEWTTSLDATGPFLSKRRGYERGLDRRIERAYAGDYDEEYTSEDWFSSHDQEEHLHTHSAKLYKYDGKNFKGHLKPGGSLSWCNTNHPSRKHIPPKWKNVWIRGKDDNDMNAHAAQVEQSEDWVSSAKSEPPEDSEEFQQLVHKFFLSFTKKLNDNPGVRKRYQEQGRAGSLFCIVCGRSSSKEFMDTQRLATHAFMSHKVGLRAQHLGLLKALCVLLGWSTAVAPDTVTWCPVPLSSVEALAQKEDLILWPPVIVIHNSSIPYNDLEGRGVTTVEALEDFLRGKGFGGGKIRIGRSVNHSIMVVKYLGTFSGLEEAEKLNRYFAINKHGRKEFNQLSSSKGKSSSSGEGEMKEGKVDELMLYGYMAIAEDLDKIDNDGKRKCLIKSKKEIQDLVDAPVKPE